MRLTFDARKRDWTLKVRGLDFARGLDVFADALATFGDERNDYGESRQVTVGYLDGRMVIVVWTERDGISRIISRRKANEGEQARYRPRR